MEPIESRIARALSADKEGIGPMLSDPSDKVIIALLSNRNITYDELFVLARRRDLPGSILEAVGARKFTDDGYRVKVALVNNPKTPRRLALGFLRGMQLRDMAFVTSNKAVPTELRQAAEGMLREKLPTLPAGIKITIARQVSEGVVKFLLMDENIQVIKACFENPRMNEATVLWAINHAAVPAGTIVFIASNLKWQARYAVKFALARNPRTPVARALDFVREMKALDLRFLYNDPSVPAVVKVQVEIELERKGQPLSPPSDSGRVIGIVDLDNAEDAEEGGIDKF
ncbi:MAG: hypothetical protein ABSG42_03925 [Nitrospirota bacterium]